MKVRLFVLLLSLTLLLSAIKADDHYNYTQYLEKVNNMTQQIAILKLKAEGGVTWFEAITISPNHTNSKLHISSEYFADLFPEINKAERRLILREPMN